MDADNSLKSGGDNGDVNCEDKLNEGEGGDGEKREEVDGEEKEKDEGTEEEKTYEAVIKVSPSDVEMSESDEEEDGGGEEEDVGGEEEDGGGEEEDGGGEDDEDDLLKVLIKNEVESEDFDESTSFDDDDEANLSTSWKGDEEEETDEEKPDEDVKVKKEPVKEKKKVGIKRKDPSSPKAKRPRGRPKQPRRLNVPEGAGDDYTSEEEGDGKLKPVLKPGSGYPVEFKLRVLKYAESHSNAATAEKFGLQAKRIRDWKKGRYKIEEESKGAWKRRPRTDGYTVEEKLQAVTFATERSVDEARLLYNVDRRTIEKWKAKRPQLEARQLQGEGHFIRRGGSGRKPRFLQIEEILRDWIVALRLKGVTVNYKMILNKAKIIMEADPSMRDLPVPRTRTWVIGFLKRQNLHGLLGNTLGHEDPRELLNAELKTSEMAMKNLADKLVDIPENPNKRNRRTISLEDKVNIIRRIEQGETQGTVAKSLKVATSTIQTIWSCRSEIMHKYVNPKSKTKSDAILWKTYNPIGAALHDWVEQNSSKIGKVDYNTLLQKATHLSETYRLPQFSTEAKPWLRVFCKKHNLTDVLTELKGNYGGGGGGSTATPLNSHVPAPPQPLPAPASTTNTAMSSVDSGDHHHDDDFQSDFNFNDFLSAMHNDPQARNNAHLLQPPQSQQTLSNASTPSSHHTPLHHASPTENNHHHHPRFSTPCNSGGMHQTSMVTTSDAVKYITLLRNWVQFNYGPHEEILNNHLSVVENAVLKKRMTDMGHTNNHPH